MKIRYLFIVNFFWIFLFEAAYPWDHEISLGYNRSREVGYDYYNSGFFLNAKLYKFKKMDKTLILTVDGSIARWEATTEEFNKLITGGLSVAFRAYFIAPEHRKFNPYLSASFGPVYLSRSRLGECEQTNHITFQTTMGVGTEIMLNDKRGVTLSLQLVHYCNAGLYKINRGINMLYVFSIGYMF
ncbi:MAG: acyloxyacyl hydrolase [Coxiellaceae bacterium]|jgi:hypothetical protein|nr:acyloxyacyl hydrolase [Coxiellaceae bacterium]